MSMDNISSGDAERDIHAYISKELEGFARSGERESSLAKKANGLFERGQSCL
jgi:hypothetical protein